MVDLHRHDMFSTYDGFDRPERLAQIAKQKGHTSLATSNHGNTNGLVQTHLACKKEGLKPILGVEGYFLPQHKDKTRGYHLCLFAANLKGYENLNIIQSEADKYYKFYTGVWNFELLEKYSEGLICTTACAGSYSSQAIVNSKKELAIKYLEKLKDIFKDNLYIEIQPYKITEIGMQELINLEMFKLSKKLNIKCILTSDSHRGLKEDYPTYLKMFEMAGKDLDMVEKIYKERYMPTKKEIALRFIRMHKDDIGVKYNIKKETKAMLDALEEIEKKVDGEILDKLELNLPQLAGENNVEQMKQLIKKGLQEKGKYNKKYINRCLEELHVLKENGFIDYFLIVHDYVNFANENNIPIGPGRGSVCNSLIAYAIGITKVDPIIFSLDFRRFMRIGKDGIPDIDLDFETDRRDEVIAYILNKYKNNSCQVASYGMYKIDNTINELAKVCGLRTDKNIDPNEVRQNKQLIAEMKKCIKNYVDNDGKLELEKLLNDLNKKTDIAAFNKEFDNIIIHFSKLYDTLKYVGTHAAGVLITSVDIRKYTALRTSKDGKIFSAYDLDDCNNINVIKFDILGLRTLSVIQDCERMTKDKVEAENIIDDKKILDGFKDGNTSAIFQFNKSAAQNILKTIEADNVEDVIATNSINRPAPLKMKMHEIYAENKKNATNEKSVLDPHTKVTYNTVIYQEQVLTICTDLGGMDWNEADTVLKSAKHGRLDALVKLEKYKKETGTDLEQKFIKSIVKKGLDKNKAVELWESFLEYGFNKGHAAGYALIAFHEMYYKVHYPLQFWYAKIKYCDKDADRNILCYNAAKNDIVFYLPHINYSDARINIKKFDGENVLVKGLSEISGIGDIAAEIIQKEREQNGIFKNYDDFYDRCKGSKVNKKIIEILKNAGALEFKKDKYIRGVITYNSSLISRA